MGDRVVLAIKRTGALLTAALVLGLPSWEAAACDSPTCSLLTRGANGLIPKGKLRLDVSFGHSSQPRLLDGSQTVDAVYRPRVFLEHGTIIPGFHRDLSGWDQGVQADVTYGLSSRLNVTGSIPLASWHAHDVVHGTLEQEYGTRGIGDALVGVRWAPGLDTLAVGLSLKLPTGPSRIGGEFGGGIQDPTLQPGTGAFDVVGSLLYAWRTRALDLRWSAAATYQRTTPNALDYRFGDQAISTLTVARPVSMRVSASLQVKLFHQDRNRYLDQDVPSTGSTVLYLTPGLRVSGPGNVSLFAYLPLATYCHVNDPQLGPRLGITTGLSKQF